ncbi:MAG TPA: DUF1700 domain-containing protein [Rhizomicrobium sp.]|jgi:uncharacterized membrane protein|nr:DUF1700 domain-containing protein [Rhizomicrobium sp.]
MTRGEFLSNLRAGLSGQRQQDIDEIMADYENHFIDGREAGRSEEEIAAALGDPSRLARELKVEAGFKRWQNEKSAGNLGGIILALLGLATIDFMLLLPCLGALFGIMIGFAAVVIVFCVVGVVLLASVLPIGFLGDIGTMVGRGLAGAGLLAGGIGAGALFLMLIEGLAKLLVKYARLHYRLLTSASQAV